MGGNKLCASILTVGTMATAALLDPIVDLRPDGRLLIHIHTATRRWSLRLCHYSSVYSSSNDGQGRRDNNLHYRARHGTSGPHPKAVGDDKIIWMMVTVCRFTLKVSPSWRSSYLRDILICNELAGSKGCADSEEPKEM